MTNLYKIFPKSKMSFVLGALILFVINSFLSNIYGLYYRFLITGIVNFLFCFYLLKINPFKSKGYFLVFLYFFAVFPVVIYSLFNDIPIPGILSFLIYIISSFFSILLVKNERHILISLAYSVVFIFLLVRHNDMMNLYYTIIEKENKIIGEYYDGIKIFNEKNELVLLQNKNKIQVIDFWSNSCGYCIKAFPVFQELKNHYKNNPDVVVYSLNIIEKKEDMERAQKYLKGFNFKNYFVDKSIYRKLNFSKVPNYMIVGKDGKIKYFGSLNIENFDGFNNAYKIIDDEK